MFIRFVKFTAFFALLATAFVGGAMCGKDFTRRAIASVHAFNTWESADCRIEPARQASR